MCWAFQSFFCSLWVSFLLSTLCHESTLYWTLFNQEIPRWTCFVYSSSYSPCCCYRNMLSPSILNNELLPSSYNIFHKDKTSRGGGVLLAVHQPFSSYLLFTSLNLEVLTVQIKAHVSLLVCVVYIPPNSSSEYQLKLTFHTWFVLFIPHQTPPLNTVLGFWKYFESILTIANTIILGDYNFTDICWSALSATLNTPRTSTTSYSNTVSLNQWIFLPISLEML